MALPSRPSPTGVAHHHMENDAAIHSQRVQDGSVGHGANAGEIPLESEAIAPSLTAP
jgi:hypothetical protein